MLIKLVGCLEIAITVFSSCPFNLLECLMINATVTQASPLKAGFWVALRVFELQD